MRTLLRRAQRDEGGFILVVVVLSLIFLLMLVTSVLSYSLGSQTISRRDEDWNAALSAAEAGIDDYIFHLNQDGSYWQYSSTNPPPDGNQAFTTWVRVPGPTSDAFYRYSVDITNIGVDGTVKVTSTGMVRNVKRSISASVRRKNFLDYLYFTDYETKDPASYDSNDDYTPTQAQTYCAKHYYEGRDIAGRVGFRRRHRREHVHGDHLHQPGHDQRTAPHERRAPNLGLPALQREDDHELGRRRREHPLLGRWFARCSPTRGIRSYADPLTMPPNNIELKQETQSVYGGTGCLFTGPDGHQAELRRDDGRHQPVQPGDQLLRLDEPELEPVLHGGFVQRVPGHADGPAAERRHLRADGPVDARPTRTSPAGAPRR